MRHAYANGKYCEITGYSASELKKIRIARLILTDKRETFKNMYQLFFHNEINIEKSFITTAIRKDEKKFSIECSRAITVWKGKPAIQLLVRDVTENLERENKIKESNKHLSSRIENITAELIASSEILKQKQNELISHKLELEKVNKELMQTNRAMSVLARNIDKKQKEVEQKTAHMVLTKILPIINDLKKEKGIQKYLPEIEVLGSYIKGLAPESDLHNKIVINLSATEMRIAALIKNGMSSQKIADILNISLETVKTHRKKIRRKLDIRNSSANLTSYLQSVMDES
jgi:PAS domain S-box-containing protein